MPLVSDLTSSIAEESAMYESSSVMATFWPYSTEAVPAIHTEISIALKSFVIVFIIRVLTGVDLSGG